MELSERIVSFILVLAMSVFFCSCGVEESNEAPATPLPTETAAAVEDIALMFYTTEIESEFTLKVGETVELHAETLPQWAANPQLLWESSNESCLEIDHRFQDELDEAHSSRLDAWLTALSAEESPVTLTIACGELEKEYTVHIVP